MSSVSFSRSLTLPISACKVVKVQALSRAASATEKQASAGEYIAAETRIDAVRSVNKRLMATAKQLDFYQQHQMLEINPHSLLGLNIDCLL
ncbi:MAG: hypothetical protein Q9N68_12315 [Gammaproteobacteria bacterium]|nr:hypothetical protein [Gammaproteobacteria bacterium]